MVRLIQNVFDLKLLLTNTTRLVPVYLSPANRTIVESDIRNSLTLSPSSFTINPPQSCDFANGFPCGKGFLILDLAEYLEFHKFLKGCLLMFLVSWERFWP